MTSNEAINHLLDFARPFVANVEHGATAVGIQKTFQPLMYIEYDRGNPRCAWINTTDEISSCHVNLRRQNTVVSYGSKVNTRARGHVERRQLR